MDRGTALSFLTSVLEGGVWSAPCPSRFTPGKDPVPIVQEAGWTPGPVWTCAKNLIPTGIRSPDCPARSQSLYWLNYPAHSVSSSTRIFLMDCSYVEMKELWSLEILESMHITTQYHIPEEMKHLQHHSENQKSCRGQNCFDECWN
jgi:hypothetical protein